MTSEPLLSPKCMAEIFKVSLAEVQKLPIPRVIVLGLSRWRPEDVGEFIAQSVVPYEQVAQPKPVGSLEEIKGIGVPIEDLGKGDWIEAIKPPEPRRPSDLLARVFAYREEVEKHGPTDSAAQMARTKMFFEADEVEAESRLHASATSGACDHVARRERTPD